MQRKVSTLFPGNQSDGSDRSPRRAGNRPQASRSWVNPQCHQGFVRLFLIYSCMHQPCICRIPPSTLIIIISALSQRALQGSNLCSTFPVTSSVQRSFLCHTDHQHLTVLYFFFCSMSDSVFPPSLAVSKQPSCQRKGPVFTKQQAQMQRVCFHQKVVELKLTLIFIPWSTFAL